MKFVSFSILLFWTTLSWAQSTSLQGHVVMQDDSAVVFAKVTFISLQDSSVSLSVQTNLEGKFSVPNINVGQYKVDIHSPEINDFSQITTITADSNQTIQFKVKRATTLHEVVVKGRREEVRLEEGKMVVNVANSLSNAGQTAVEVLRKSPGVSVDQDGNIQLRGKNGVLVMIDDKPMYLSGDQLASLLKAIPAEQIKEIEIITAPSAKYDASGNGGIINIRLKKGAYEGLTGRMNTSFGYGVYHKATAGVNITYKKKKWTTNWNYQFGSRKGLSDFGNVRINQNENVTNNQFINKTYYSIPGINQSLQFSGDFKMSKNTSLSYDFNNNLNRYLWKGNTNSELRNQSDNLVNTYSGEETGRHLNLNSYSGLTLQHTLDTLGSKLTVLLAFNKNQGWKEKSQDIRTYNPDGSMVNTPFLFDQQNDNHSNFYMSQVDWLKRTKKIKWESGIKYTHLEFENPFETEIEQNAIITTTLSRYYYQEQVLGSYAMMSRSIKKWSLQAGLRMENTWMFASFSQADTSFSRKYSNLFPSGSISYKQTEKTSYSLSFSRRITRPTPEQLNPILNYLDPYSAYSGDAFLRPQLTNTGELSYSILGGSFITSLQYSYIERPIVWVAREDKTTGIFIGGMRNLDVQYSTGVLFSLNLPFAKWWSANYNLNVSNNAFRGDAGFGNIDNQRTGWSAKSSHRITLPKDYSLEFSGTYDSPSSYAFATDKSRWQLNAAIQKKVLKKQGTLKLAVNDVAWKFYFRGNSQLGPVNLDSYYRWDNRTVILSFNYKFGNPLMKD